MLLSTVCRLPVLATICNTSSGSTYLQRSSLHLTSCLQTKTAGRYKPSLKRDKPLTYEQANKPDQIGVRKSWNAFNNSNIDGFPDPALVTHEDMFIRKFMHGTWPRLIASDVIIKRRANQINLIFMATREITPQKMYFLIGYTEEILGYILKSCVKVDIQTISDASDLTYKYI